MSPDILSLEVYYSTVFVKEGKEILVAIVVTSRIAIQIESGQKHISLAVNVINRKNLKIVFCKLKV